MFLKPTSPLVNVPDPAQQGTPGYWLPADGRDVEPSMYWTRRLLDGDVVEAAPPATVTAPEPEQVVEQAPERATSAPPAAD